MSSLFLQTNPIPVIPSSNFLLRRSECINGDNSAGKVTTLAFANFSQALGKLTGNQAGKSGGSYGVTPMDYSKQELSTSAEKRTEVGRKLVAAGVELEQAFKGPQDVEGAFVGGDIYIVQTRAQP